MRLHEIIEGQMYSVDQYEPSGNGGPTSVDPDRLDKMLNPKGDKYSKSEDANNADRSKRMKKKWQIRRNQKAEPKETGQVVSTNTDLTGSGQNGMMNGSERY